MADFNFIQNKINGKWVISAPRRSHRTNAEKPTDTCPFCPGNELAEEELFRIEDANSGWAVRVVTNRFPFAPHHEVIIHSPDHHKNWDELPQESVELILKTYRERYNFHKKGGPSFAKATAGKQVYIFHNSGFAAGASLTHPHSQLVVVPHNVKLDITPLDQSIYKLESGITNYESGDRLETEHFLIFCPATSEWPDEVWIAPKQNGGGFGFIKDNEIKDLGFALARIIQIEDLRHGHEFPYNFYISPNKNWYLRLIPRIKIAGGFELGTNIIVNTQDPAETFAFLKEHFHEPDNEKIKKHHQAEYRKGA